MHGQYCYNMYVHVRSLLLQLCICMYGQYCYNMYVHACMVSTATVCMYRHGQYCYNMYMHGTYPGLPGSVPQISYSLHMLTTLGRDLLGQGKGTVGQLGTLLSCTTSCSLSYLVYHHTT